MTGKYAPLELYLKSLPVNQAEISLSFDQIEQVLMPSYRPQRNTIRCGGPTNESVRTCKHIAGWIRVGRWIR